MIRVKSIRLLGLLTMIAVPSLSFGQAEAEFAILISRAQDKIETSLDEYQAFLQETQSDKLELVTQINKLENDLVKLRQSELVAKRDATESKLLLEELQTRIKALDTQAQYSQGVLSEYLTNFESRIHVSEDQLYLEPLRETRETLSNTPDDPAERLPILFQALDLGIARQEELVGGRQFEGRAITPLGGVKRGKIAVVGPVAFFSGADGNDAGPLRFNSGTIEPGLSTIAQKDATLLREVLASGNGMLPLDSSLGNALVLEKAKGTITEHISKGGWVGYAILVLGAVAIAVSLFKIVDLQNIRVQEPDELDSIAKSATSDTIEAAKAKIAALKGPIHKMLSIGIDFSRTDTDTQLDAMESSILRYRPRLERFLPILATTAAVAPLMGLLGTVVGMIKTFTLIEVFGTGDAKSLSSGISEALVTTELGLIVAIPALIFHGIFTRIMRSRIGAMEQIATDFSRLVFAVRNKEKVDK
ncbi:MotA/TolQ/ExbB proton channel family protein [Pelagicoccus sp. SDUM812002]|uniref:MotA/TolQ/ExbB proton channel family protein n=1 Tax=Pelagicoccus sp. SDUM812002 TaxID=3041266 RepID=UPI00280C995B|nr:MotA/TolQ/ExbB proton channel family protein [Pelagicoccus sp. SDUM812002]MDQ8186345.1 MotA/TolQ/ExbB proton channel family protein [Pelagicoccus sp. SDUM812002]